MADLEREGKEGELHEFTTIGLAGPAGAGKSTVGEFLQNNFGLPRFTISDLLRRLARSQQIEPPYTREILNDIYHKLVAEQGEGAAIKLSTELIDAFQALTQVGGGAPLDGVTIDGIKYAHEAIELATKPNSFLIVVNAQRETRFERIIHRERPGDIVDWEEFKAHDNSEMQRLAPVFEIADFVIDNNGDLEHLEQRLMYFIFEETNLF